MVLADAEGLKRRGHDVLPFSSAHGLNEQTATGRYFPPSVDHGALGSGMSVLQRSRAAIDLFHNRRAASAFGFMVQQQRPNLAHQHGLARQYPPSVLERAKSLGLPTVLTLHDYSLRCPSGDLSRAGASESIEVSVPDTDMIAPSGSPASKPLPVRSQQRNSL